VAVALLKASWKEKELLLQTLLHPALVPTFAEVTPALETALWSPLAVATRVEPLDESTTLLLVLVMALSQLLLPLRATPPLLIAAWAPLAPAEMLLTRADSLKVLPVSVTEVVILTLDDARAIPPLDTAPTVPPIATSKILPLSEIKTKLPVFPVLLVPGELTT
jgi:hypothetical protein